MTALHGLPEQYTGFFTAIRAQRTLRNLDLFSFKKKWILSILKVTPIPDRVIIVFSMQIEREVEIEEDEIVEVEVEVEEIPV